MISNFIDECKTVRKNFAKIARQYRVQEHLKLRTEIDTLLIMYDQLCERLANVGIIIPKKSKKTFLFTIWKWIKKIQNDNTKQKNIKQTIEIAYLNAEDSTDLDYETSNGTGRENRKKAILEHPNVEYYTLNDFIDAFNNGYISDLGCVAIKK